MSGGRGRERAGNGGGLPNAGGRERRAGLVGGDGCAVAVGNERVVKLDGGRGRGVDGGGDGGGVDWRVATEEGALALESGGVEGRLSLGS